MKQDGPAFPFAATLVGVALYSLMDAMMKGSSLALGAYSALFWRNLVAAIVLIPLWHLRGSRWPDPATVRLHILRGVVAAGMALTFFYALTLLPMAEAIAISFIAPLIALYLAAAMLGETIRRSAVAASLVGLAGVAVIALARLGSSAHDDRAAIGIGAVLLSAMLYAWNLVLQRRQAQLAKPLEVATFMNTVVLLTLAPFAPWFAQLPESPALAAVLAGAALLSVVAGMLFSWAYARAEAQVLVPVEYSAFVWAALMGWLAFGERLTWPTLAGTALVVAACWIAAPRRRPEPVAV
ncbi:MAG: DMT family transporter [Croceibacterium sp.]